MTPSDMAPDDPGSNSLPMPPADPASAPPAPAHPAKVGRYEIQGELGRGAMGHVYRAFDPNIGRNVALKVIPIDSGEPEMAARFRREAQAAGILSHPNIVTIFDAGSDAGFLYIAMELVEGETLHKMLLSGALPLQQAVAISEQTAAALDHAHARGIIHRDIKPANIMVQGGQVKVADFGVAKTGAAGMTSTGLILGTPSYLAPEVVKGEAVSARSDIFSLGVVLYEMLTAIRPFAGDTLTTVIYRILSETPQPPAEVIASLPSEINDVVLKALAKNPEDRYSSGGELAADLKRHTAPEIQGRQHPLRKTAESSETEAEIKDEMKEKTEPLDPRTLVAAASLSNSAFTRIRAIWAGAATVLLLGGAILWRVHNASTPLIPASALAPSSAAPTGAEGTDNGPGAASPAMRAQLGSPAPAGDSTADKPSPFGSPVTPGSADGSAGASTDANQASASEAKGRVLVRTLPAGAVVRVNDDTTEYQTPVNFALAPGHYQITIEHSGFRTETREIDVEANHEVTLDIEMRRGLFRRLNPFRH